MFIKSMVLEKDEENDSFKIIKINFRSRYLDELKKLNKEQQIKMNILKESKNNV